MLSAAQLRRECHRVRSEIQSKPLTASRAAGLKGRVRVPGDKSISHRSLIFGLMTIGETAIEGLLEGADVLATAEACRKLGAQTKRVGEGSWRVRGVGVGGLLSPDGPLDFGNAGTGSRLMMGVVAGHGVTATFDGDASLRKRPMMRVLSPLLSMGAEIVSSAEGGRLPLVLRGAVDPVAITYETPVPSAQVKSAVLLAGLNAVGRTTVIEAEATRDHTERMLTHFGASVSVVPHGAHGARIELEGRPELRPNPVMVPADPSSAAFPIAAALITPGSDIVVEGVMMNPSRTGLVTTLREMGGDIVELDRRIEGGESVADLRIRHSALAGVTVPAARAPSMIDEYPVLAVAAAFASGTTRMNGLSELRVKESDRLAAVAAGLAANQIEHHIAGDDLLVDGNGSAPGGGLVTTHMDHRIAMAFLVMGLAAAKPVTVDDVGFIATSFPTFIPMMEGLGGQFG